MLKMLITGLFAVCLLSPVGAEGKRDLKLWYKQQAGKWMESTPVGNGRLGAMVFGGINRETIALNEITMWSGQPDTDQEIACGKEKLAGIRQLFFDGKPIEGNKMCGQFLVGKPNSFGTHLPVGDLHLTFGHDVGKATDYNRQLDLRNAITTVSYSIDGIRYQREYFCSNPDGVLVIKLSADRKGALDFDLGLSLLREAEVTAADGEVAFTGKAAFPKFGPGGVNFAGKVKVTTTAGTTIATNGTLKVSGADEAVIVVDIRTDFKNPAYAQQCANTVRKAASKTYDKLKFGHIRDYCALFERVDLFLGESAADRLPTDERWRRLRQGSTDVGLEALFFHYGRYLIIASSREDSPLPANLQGVWNDNLACNMPWTCDYHLDVNTQQNYWITNITNLHECNAPLFRYIEDLAVAGEQTARKVYGSPGWVAHTVANVWGYTAPGEGVNWGLFPTASTWIASHLWQHYAFTGDRDFLRRQAYPLLKKNAVFFLDYMVTDPATGYLLTGPSGSPENSFRTDGWELAISMMPTCDRVLIHELYTACIQASDILGVDAGFRDTLEQALKKLPPLQIGKNGEVQEWLADVENAHPNHRCATHLLSLYPFSQISLQHTPALAKAAKAVIDNRLAAPDWEDVEFSRANMISYYARLKEPAEAYNSLSVLLHKLIQENLFTISVPGIAGAESDIFIFDGNEAAPAGMAEMLVQSHEGYIELLPALPAQWQTGYFKGLCVRGGGEIDLVWADGKVEKARIKANTNTTFRVKLPAPANRLSLKKNGRTLHLKTDADNAVSVSLRKNETFEIEKI